MGEARPFPALTERDSNAYVALRQVTDDLAQARLELAEEIKGELRGRLDTFLMSEATSDKRRDAEARFATLPNSDSVTELKAYIAALEDHRHYLTLIIQSSMNRES